MKISNLKAAFLVVGATVGAGALIVQQIADHLAPQACGEKNGVGLVLENTGNLPIVREARGSFQIVTRGERQVCIVDGIETPYRPDLYQWASRQGILSRELR